LCGGRYLVLPKGVNVIFTDEGKGRIGGLDDIHLANGLYYHTMMLDGSSNQITEMISPSLAFSQLWQMVANASSLFYIVDNVSDMLPALLSTGAVFKFAWDPAPFTVNGSDTNWTVAQHDYLRNWSAVQFGEPQAEVAANLYDRYFAIPHIAKGNSDEWIGATLGKLGGSGAADISGSGAISNTTVATAQKALASVQPSLAPCASLHADVVKFAALVPPNRLEFYRQHLAWQTACQHFGVVAISELAQSLLATTHDDAVAHVNASIAAIDSLFAAQRAGEGDGQWSGLYFGDRLDYTCVPHNISLEFAPCTTPFRFLACLAYLHTCSCMGTYATLFSLACVPRIPAHARARACASRRMHTTRSDAQTHLTPHHHSTPLITNSNIM
jgi:hypothetical protein